MNFQDYILELETLWKADRISMSELAKERATVLDFADKGKTEWS